METPDVSVKIFGLDDPEHDVRLITQEINQLLEPLISENDPNLMMWALQEVATSYTIELHGTLTALKILTNSMNNVIDIGPYVEAQMKGVH
jgi:hypothetical protein